MVLPNTIHHDAGSKGIVGPGQPFCEPQAAAGGMWGGNRIACSDICKYRWDGRLNLLPLPGRVSTLQDVCLGISVLFLVPNVYRWRLGRQAVFCLPQA